MFAYSFIFIHLVGITIYRSQKAQILSVQFDEFDICKHPWNHHPKQNRIYVITPESFFMLLLDDFTPIPNKPIFWLLSCIYFCYCFCYFACYCTSHSLSQVAHVCVCMCVRMYLLSPSILDIHITVLISSSSFSLLRFMIWLYCNLFTHSLVDERRGIPVLGCYE